MKPRLSARELVQHIKNTKIFDRVLDKVKIISVENGSGIAEFTVEEEHTNSIGGLHTGFAAMVTDLLSSFSFSTHEFGNNYHVSMDMQLTFFQSPPKIGDQIEVHAKTLKGGHSIAFLEVIMKNKTTGDLVLKGNHNMFILHPHLLKDNEKGNLIKHGLEKKDPILQ